MATNPGAAAINALDSALKQHPRPAGVLVGMDLFAALNTANRLKEPPELYRDASAFLRQMKDGPWIWRAELPDGFGFRFPPT